MSSRTKRTGRWTNALRSPWTVVCAVVTVVLGPAAATASALDRANAAPPRHVSPEGERPGHPLRPTAP